MNPTNGLLLIDKSQGMTSHDVVAKARRILGIRAIGHAGTLDPLASGLLVLLVGEGTKVSDFLLTGDKGYEVVVRLGQRTDSMDITGQVIEEKPVMVSDDEIRRAVEGLEGALRLAVPVHSAVKVDGRKLYELAHRGQAPTEVPVREMTFTNLNVGEILRRPEGPVEVRVRMRCSKGSFVRSWANELGCRLQCGGTVAALRRVFSDPFEVSQSMTLEDLAQRWDARTERHGRVLQPAWVPLKDSLPRFPRIDVAGQDEVLMRNGQISKNVQALLLQQIRLGEVPPPVRIVSRDSDDLVALLTAEAGQFYKIRRVFHNA
jgi:tRNA pseudouridine55 synthase